MRSPRGLSLGKNLRAIGIRARSRDLYRTRPPLLGGAALIGADGRLIGIGSLHVQHANGPRIAPRRQQWVVPIDLLSPILDDMLTYGRRTVRLVPGSVSMLRKSRMR